MSDECRSMSPMDRNELCPAENSWRHRFSRSRSPERGMEPPKCLDVCGMFDTDRCTFSEKWKLVPLVLWAPVGTLLALVRVFMCFHVYLAANLLPQPSLIRRFVLRWMWAVMGLVVTVHEEEEKSGGVEHDQASVLISNHVSPLDTLAVHFVTDSMSPHLAGLPVWFRCAYGWHDFGWRENVDGGGPTSLGHQRSASVAQKINRFVTGQTKGGLMPVHVLPEGCRTNGRVGLLRFQPWWVPALGGVNGENGQDSSSEASSTEGSSRIGVRPVALTWSRPTLPCPVRISTVDSSAWADLFWVFFCPFTFVEIRFLPVVWRSAADTNADDFSLFVARKIATALSSRLEKDGDGKTPMEVVVTSYNCGDRDEYIKKLMFESISRPLPNARAASTYPLEIMSMAERLKEVIPTVPVVAIAADLSRTGSMEQTLTNFLEGHVTYTPEADGAERSDAHQKQAVSKREPASKPMGKSSRDPTLSFTERKAAMIEEARYRYLLKHPEVVGVDSS